MRGRDRNKNRSNSYEKAAPKVFMANQFTKDLKQGKLPFKRGNQRIANFGSGFSNMLSLVASPKNNYLTAGKGPVVASREFSKDQGSLGSQTRTRSSKDLQEDSLFDQSEAHFKVYRPDCKTIPYPYTYKEAVREYRRKDGSIDDMERGKPLTNRSKKRRINGQSDARQQLIANMHKTSVPSGRFNQTRNTMRDE